MSLFAFGFAKSKRKIVGDGGDEEEKDFNKKSRCADMSSEAVQANHSYGPKAKPSTSKLPNNGECMIYAFDYRQKFTIGTCTSFHAARIRQRLGFICLLGHFRSSRFTFHLKANLVGKLQNKKILAQVLPK